MSRPQPPRLLCLGDLNLDLVITPQRSLAAGSDTPGSVVVSGGGSAANVAAWAAGPAIAVRFVGTVGDDAAGTMLVEGLETLGVETEVVVRIGARSRTIAALIDTTSGDRSMISDLDERVALRPDDFRAGWLDGVDWLHLTGYTFLDGRSRPLFATLIDAANERGIPWSVDPSSADMLRAGDSVGGFLHACTGAAVLFPNLDEAVCLTGCDDPAVAASSLLTVAHTVAVTCGADGVWVASRRHDPAHVPAPRVAVTNTLGAGDAFAAGFLRAHLTGADTVAAAEQGVALATRAVTSPTARPNVL